MSDVLIEFGLSSEFKGLKQRVAKANGGVLVIVHPFFQEKINPDPISYKEYKKRLIATLRASKKPIIILEENRGVGKLSQTLDSLGIKATIVPTINDNAFLGTKKNTYKYLSHKYAGQPALTEKEKIAPLAELLTHLETKSIQLGGSLAYEEVSILRAQIIRAFERSWIPKRLIPKVTIGKGCLGATYARLIDHHAKDFKKIRLMPKLCYPEEPKFGKPKKPKFNQHKRR